MKKLSFILFICLLVLTASSQSYTATITPNGTITITDPAQPQPLAGFDALAVEWTALGGGCTIWESGKLTPASSYTLTLPASFAAGCMLQKTIWRGKLQPNGTMKWQGQGIECAALVLPTASSTSITDTIFLQAITVSIPSSTYNVDWQQPHVNDNRITFEPNDLQPAGVKTTYQQVTSAAGWHMPNPDYLPAGLYFAVTVWEWQGMTFVETDEFIIN